MYRRTFYLHCTALYCIVLHRMTRPRRARGAAAAPAPPRPPACAPQRRQPCRPPLPQAARQRPAPTSAPAGRVGGAAVALLEGVWRACEDGTRGCCEWKERGVGRAKTEKEVSGWGRKE
eukprot:362942-Chlamydomonas_euryale.AAC.2